MTYKLSNKRSLVTQTQAVLEKWPRRNLTGRRQEITGENMGTGHETSLLAPHRSAHRAGDPITEPPAKGTEAAKPNSANLTVLALEIFFCKCI